MLQNKECVFRYLICFTIFSIFVSSLETSIKYPIWIENGMKIDFWFFWMIKIFIISFFINIYVWKKYLDLKNNDHFQGDAKDA